MIIAKRQRLQEAKLYLVLDTDVSTDERLLDVLGKSLTSGIDIVQLRAKGRSDREVLNLAKEAQDIIRGRVPFIINDRPDLALSANADGVHVGQTDMPVKIARRLMGKYKIVGSSCQTLEQAHNAQAAGADYIGFGSVFKTLTKPHREPMNLRLLEDVFRKMHIPVFAIGGITTDNIKALREAGVDKVAVTRAVSCAGNISEAVKAFKLALSTKQTS